MTKYVAEITETRIVEIDSEFPLDSDALFENFKEIAEEIEEETHLRMRAKGVYTIVTHRNWDDIRESKE